MLKAEFILWSFRTEAVYQPSHTGRFFALILLILQINIVYHLTYCGQGTIAQQFMRGKQNLEGAGIADVREFSAEHIEPKLSRVVRVMSRIDKPESRRRVDEASNQPCGRDPIDVNALAGHPNASLVFS